MPKQIRLTVIAHSALVHSSFFILQIPWQKGNQIPRLVSPSLVVRIFYLWLLTRNLPTHVLCLVGLCILILALAIPFAELIIGNKYGDEASCSSMGISFKTWLYIKGGTAVAVSAVLFFIWLLIGAVMFWRDCSSLEPRPLNIMMWCSLIFGFLGCCGAGTYLLSHKSGIFHNLSVRHHRSFHKKRLWIASSHCFVHFVSFQCPVKLNDNNLFLYHRWEREVSCYWRQCYSISMLKREWTPPPPFQFLNPNHRNRHRNHP